MVPAASPPASTVGFIGWARANLFSSPGNIALTLLGVLVAWYLISGLLEFALLDATWTGTDGSACRGRSGACWPYVATYIDTFVYGRYPEGERWRVDIVFVLFVLLLAPLLIPSAPFKLANALLFFVAFPIVAFILLIGGYFGLEYVETTAWGGLLVTLVIAVTGIVVSLPAGIVLALGRRSKLPAIRLLSTIYIEFWRGVPLITVLWVASNMLPIFLPKGVDIDKLLRAIVGVAMFASAYMAEVVRGGLQAIPKGQYEGAMALGLSYPQMMGFIILPQALKLVIPGIVNTFIGLFKDTSLVAVVSLFDLLGQIQNTLTNPNWASPTTAATGYLVAALIYFVFCFGMSRYSMWMERRLDTGHRR